MSLSRNGIDVFTGGIGLPVASSAARTSFPLPSNRNPNICLDKQKSKLTGHSLWATPILRHNFLPVDIYLSARALARRYNFV